ncbi:hypothetical protein H072_6353 [Dactylellina haptotyla CBS 200.50]|uniref:Uncharacterized protein n=1 Tax=Dactylellina haptotyla (strain CBS 200.50) TaxID=1284197 RepID=S8AFC8_DACHA|nr:hypothetical protein H072_6353 [Dactylellina haptotyla CBS 200.50]
MPSLDTLPLDIKILILINLSDGHDIVSLTTASRQFEGVYNRFKDKVLLEVYPPDIRKYQMEAFSIAGFSESLEAWFLPKEKLSDIISVYARGEERPLWMREIEIDWNVLIKNHQTVERLCRVFVERELEMHSKMATPLGTDHNEKGDEKATTELLEGRGMINSVSGTEPKLEDPEPPATTSEKERITRAIYRFWLILLIFRRRSDEPSFINLYEIELEDFYYLFDSWSFWETLSVKAIGDFFWSELEPFAVEVEAKDWLTTRFGIGKMLKPLRLSYITYNQFALIVRRDFPENIMSWIDNKHLPERCVGKLEQLYEEAWKKPEEHQLKALWSPRWVYLFENYLSGNVDEYDLVKNIWLETTPRYICQPDHIPFFFGEESGQASWVRPWVGRRVQDIEFQLCVWDDSRLERWGYVQPRFLSYEETKEGGKVRWKADQLRWRRAQNGEMFSTSIHQMSTYQVRWVRELEDERDTFFGDTYL